MHLRLLKFLQWFRIKVTSGRHNEEVEKEENAVPWNNPYIPYMRQILEQVLTEKGMDYREFKPVVIDEAPGEGKKKFTHLENEINFKSDLDSPFYDIDFTEEDIWLVLQQLEPDLNYLCIMTDRPEQFLEFARKMYEENGLLVSITEKQRGETLGGNVILDFQRYGKCEKGILTEQMLYIPIYKTPWREGRNLDIIVPIGYNTVIVKGVSSMVEQQISDHFELEFQKQ